MGKTSTYSRTFSHTEASGSIVLDPPPSVSWQVWPILNRPLWGAGILAAIFIAGLITWSLTGRPQLGLLATVALLASIWRFFLPTSFELDRHGLNQQRFGKPRLVPWKSIRRHERCQTGVLLLPHRDDCPLDRLRGLFLPWADNRTEVLAHIDFHLGGRDK